MFQQPERSALMDYPISNSASTNHQAQLFLILLIDWFDLAVLVLSFNCASSRSAQAQQFSHNSTVGFIPDQDQIHIPHCKAESQPLGLQGSPPHYILSPFPVVLWELAFRSELHCCLTSLSASRKKESSRKGGMLSVLIACRSSIWWIVIPN